MKQHLLVGILTLAALSAGCAKDKGPTAGPIQPVPLNSFHKAWYADLGMNGGSATNIYVFDDFVIIYASDNTAHVVDRKSGALKFIHPLPAKAGTQHAPSVFGDRIVYPATSAFKVYSSKGGGKLMKEMQTDFAIRSGGAGMGQFYYVAADRPTGGRVVALDLETQTALPRWEVMTVAPIRSAPVHAGSITYFAAENGKVWAVNESRTSIWGRDDSPDGAFKADAAIYADLAFENGVVYVASMDSKLYALSQASGQMKWRYYSGGIPLRDKPDITSDTVYLKVQGKGLVAINRNEGKDIRDARWTNADATKFLADDDKHTFVLTRDNRITALDKATGKAKWSSKRNDFTAFGTNQKDGQIYATTKRGELYCIKAVTKQGVVGEVVIVEQLLELASR